MNRRVTYPVLIAVLLLLGAGLLAAAAIRLGRSSPTEVALAAPNDFSGPVEGGCYLQTPVQCSIHIQQWQPIVTNSGQKLVGFRLVAHREEGREDSVLHDFRTDISNPPSGMYQPSLVRQDYAAECSVTYRLTLLVRDTSNEAYTQTGETNLFTCPAAATPTPTPTPSPTTTATPSPTTTATLSPTTTATLSPTPSSTPTVTPISVATPPVLDELILLPITISD